MIMFRDRLEMLRETVLEYIKNKVNEQATYYSNTLFHFDEEGEIIRFGSPDEDIYMYRRESAKKSGIPLWKNIDTLQMEHLCKLADLIHLYPLKYLKH